MGNGPLFKAATTATTVFLKLEEMAKLVMDLDLATGIEVS